MTDWLDRFFKFAGLDEPADLSKAPPEPPRPLTQEELRARMDAQYDEYKRSRAGQEARAAFRRNSLPNILRQTAFNKVQSSPFGSIFGGGSAGWHLGQPTDADLLNEAADEIDRLRARVAELEKN